MIYNKRDGNAKINRDDFDCVELSDKNVARFNQNDFSPVVIPKKAKRRIKLRACKIKRQRRAFGKYTAALLLLSVLVCGMIMDYRLFDGAAFGGICRAIGKLSNSPQQESVGMTLYSRLSFGKEVVTENYNTPQEEAEVNQENAVSVGETVSGVGVDGKKYYPIVSNDLSATDIHLLSNETSYKPDMAEVMAMSPDALENVEVSDEPLVLILHTHGGECYTDYENMYPQDDATRSLDINKNVVRVGKEISDTLWNFGVSNIHCEAMHDEKSFINAYNESAKTVEKYLEEYPSIRFVIDVHRDAIIRDDGGAVKAVKNIGGKDYAQIMFVVGTGERGHEHDTWKENLSLAAHLQQSIDTTYPGICRSINLRDVPFNQWLSKGYLLLEVGTCSNTLDEALNSARAFGENLARSILVGI